MSSQLEEQIRDYTEVLFSTAPTVEELLPTQLIAEEGGSAETVEITIGQLPTSRRPARPWLYGVAAALAVLVLATPILLWKGNQDDLRDTVTFTSTPTTIVTGSELAGEWHRNNNDRDHEALTCEVRDQDVSCFYTKIPEPELGWGTDGVDGDFTGHLADETTCPTYLQDACRTAVVIAQGTMTFTSGVETIQTYAVQDDGSMILSWDTPGFFGSPFQCPWFRSFQTALEQPSACS